MKKVPNGLWSGSIFGDLGTDLVGSDLLPVILGFLFLFVMTQSIHVGMADIVS